MFRSEMRLATAILLFAVAVLAPSLTFAFRNEPDGFRGIKWGTEIAQVPDMVLDKGAGDLKWYRRKSDKLKIGDADVDYIVYGFYKNEFLSVLIGYKGFRNFTELKAILFHQYGEGRKLGQSLEQYWWLGNNVSIKLEFGEVSEVGQIWYNYRPNNGQLRNDDKENAKKGAKDL